MTERKALIIDNGRHQTMASGDTLEGTLPSIGSSTDKALVRWSGIEGKLVSDSNVVLSDTGTMTGIEEIITKEGVSIKGIIVNNTSTGVVNGYNLAVNGTGVSISSGVARFTDSTDSLNPTYKEVASGPYPFMPVLNVTTEPATYYYLADTGSITITNAPPTTQSTREVAYIGLAYHITQDGSIQGVSNRKVPVLNPVSSLSDTARAIGDINVDGNLFSGIDGTLTMRKTSGSVFSLGSNLSNNVNDPNFLDQPDLPLVSYLRTYGDAVNGFAYGAGVQTNVVVNEYWNTSTGSLEPLSANDWTVHRIFLGPVNNLVTMVVGQNVYNKKEDALSAIATEQIDVNVAITKTSSLRTYLVVRGGTANLADIEQAEFVNTNKFGLAGGSGGGTTTVTPVDPSITEFDASVGLNADYADINALMNAMNAVDLPLSNVKALVISPLNLDATQTINKDGVELIFKPNALITAGVATTAITISGSDCTIEGAKIEGFTIGINITGSDNIITRSRFTNNTDSITDNGVRTSLAMNIER